MPVASSWLTAPRVRRLSAVLTVIPERTPGIAEDAARLPIWRKCGGPIEEVPALWQVLVHAELVARDHGILRLTPAGRKTVTRNRADNERPLALALIRSGLMHDQARSLLDTFPTNPDGGLTCRVHHAQRVAPQLVGLLERWTVRAGQVLEVPASLVAELVAVWALIAPPSDAIAAEDLRRKAIGNRAEAYSYQFERLAATNSSDIVWVAQDDDDLGYDIEDRSTTPRRRIEVKGSGGVVPRFFMSDNEWRQAHMDPSTYEIQFWGGIELNRPAAEEYPGLRSKGYPIILRDLNAMADAGLIHAKPERWRVSTTIRATSAVADL